MGQVNLSVNNVGSPKGVTRGFSSSDKLGERGIGILIAWTSHLFTAEDADFYLNSEIIKIPVVSPSLREIKRRKLGTFTQLMDSFAALTYLSILH